MDIAIFQPIFSFIHCYQFHRRFQLFPLSPLPFLLHRSTPCLSVHLHRRILPSPRFFFFCFTPLRSLQPVLRQPVIPPLFFWLANCAHTRALEHTKRHLCRFPFFLSLLALAPLLEAPLLIANMPITVIYKRRAFSCTHAPAFLVPDFHQNRRIVRSTVLLPSVVFFSLSPPLAQGVFEKSLRRASPSLSCNYWLITVFNSISIVKKRFTR